MTRDMLDLRGKTMTELIEMDAEVGNRLDDFSALVFADNLADRRQIREEMQRRQAEPFQFTGMTDDGLACYEG